MLGRYGRYGAALGGLTAILLLGAAAPAPTSSPSSEKVQQAPKQQQSTANPASEGNAQAPSANVRIAPRQPVPDSKPAKAQESQHGIELGSWPDWVIVAFTLVLTWVAILQHRLEARTARETGEALRIAKQSADAATQSALATHRLASQLRPWVAVKGITVFNVAIPIGPQLPPTTAALTDPTRGPYIGYDFINIGAGPALNARGTFSWAFREYPLTKKLPHTPFGVQASRSTMFPGMPFSKGLQMPTALSEEDLQALRDGTKAIYLYGLIQYEDSLGAKCRTRFRFYYNALSGIVGGNNAMTLYHRGNQST